MCFLQTATPESLPSLIQWGILGLVLVLLITGFLWPKGAVDDLKAQHDKARQAWQEDRRLDREALEQRLLPQIAEMVRAYGLTNSELSKLDGLLHDLITKLIRETDSRR